jgi:uncharacterized membrane protein YgdD (TMEM256/DUF423 family)
MQSLFLFIGAFSAAVGVGMGAFGAHVLKETLTSEMLSVYQTGVTYQMWHSLALIAVSLMQQHTPRSPLLQWTGGLFVVGILFFSGSLYALTLLNQPWLGMFTPIGGVCFIAAWLTVCGFALQKTASGRYGGAGAVRKATKSSGRYRQETHHDE